jgi:hypothetical protein
MNGSSPQGFFTGVSPDRYRLPHRRLGLPVILLIRRVLCAAFEILREQGLRLGEAEEDDLTAWLRSVIENDLRGSGRINGFSKSTFECVARQGQVANYDGTRRAKAPDLCFKLRDEQIEPYTALSEFDALFVECKPVDRTHSAGSKYCDGGVARFVDGDYAWAMQEGMMLGYVRHGRSVAAHLVPAMKAGNRMAALCTERLPEEVPGEYTKESIMAGPVYVSIHRRNFEWLHGKGRATELTLYHLWIECN